MPGTLCVDAVSNSKAMNKQGKAPIAHAASGEPKISVTAQQSRFHTDAEDSTPAKEIIVKDLNINIGERELLSHADLNLQPGRHYVLVGRNGVGKSTLLTAIGTGLVPGLPQALRILLLGQVQAAGDAGDRKDISQTETETVLQHVIRADKRRERLLYEARRLSEALQDTDDPTAPAHVYRDLMHQKLEEQTAHSKLIAARQSGARGLKARKTLIQLEKELSHSAESLASVTTVESTTVAHETEKACDMLTDVQIALEAMNASAADANARSVLLGLGFSAESIDKPMSHLSGGWQTRCSLACALCQCSDLLLLDEPTNFLDLPSIIWLEKYIKDMDPETTVIVVTHDRAFADGVADELIVLRNQVLERFRGNVSAYEMDRIKTYKYLNRMKEAQEKQKKHIQSTIDSNVKAARRAGDDKKLKQAASRKKKLDERMGMEVSAKGTRFKLNRDLAGWHNSRRDEIDVPTFDPPARIAFPARPSNLRFPGALLSFSNVSFTYSKTKSAVLREINLTINLGDRVGLAGLNGSGKSTLVSLAMNDLDSTGTLIASKGSVSRHTRARFGMYSQQAAKELEALGFGNPSLTALAHLMDFAGSELQEKDARGLLSSLGLPPRSQADVPLALLSGGQKVRLALAKILWTPPHLLILDEVTTHLDADTIQALALALRKYEGAILIITHDRFFMRCVVEGESSKTMARNVVAEDDDDGDSDSGSTDEDEHVKEGVVYRLSKGTLTKLERGMQQYEERAAKASAKLSKA
nr:abc transporter f family member 3 [Quercus suber]